MITEISFYHISIVLPIKFCVIFQESDLIALRQAVLASINNVSRNSVYFVKALCDAKNLQPKRSVGCEFV